METVKKANRNFVPISSPESLQLYGKRMVAERDSAKNPYISLFYYWLAEQ